MTGKTKKKPSWWMIPSIVVASVAALTALGTFITKSSDYIELPEAVAATQVKNDEQDSAIDKLTAIQATWQDIYQQQQAVPDIMVRYHKRQKQCCNASRYHCEADEHWYTCQ